MKNIILIGPPRSGKSTFARRIMEEYKNYHLISNDAYFDAYVTALQNVHGMQSSSLPLRMVDNNFFQEFLLQIFHFSIVHFPIFNFILDTSPIPFSKIHDFLKNKKNTIVLVFGYPHISFNEKVKEIKMYETEED